MTRYFLTSMTIITIAVSISSCASDVSRITDLDQLAFGRCMNVDEIRSNIDALDGQPVIVCGVLNYEFEDINLYKNYASAKTYSRNQCISLSIPMDTTQDYSEMSRKKVRIEAVATAHFCPVGAICAASCSDSGLHVSNITQIK